MPLQRHIDAVFHLIKARLFLKKTKGAQATLKKIPKADKEQPMALGAEALVLLATGDAKAAFLKLKKALRGSPNDCELLMALAMTNWRLGNYSSVSSSCNKVISLCPNMPEPQLYHGYVSYKKYQKNQAKEYFKTYTKMGGDEALLPKGFK
jgi:Flp pilus assembly protein TadD